MKKRGECEKGPYEIACDGQFEGEGRGLKSGRIDGNNTLLPGKGKKGEKT